MMRRVMLLIVLSVGVPTVADGAAAEPPADPHRRLDEILERSPYRRWELRERRTRRNYRPRAEEDTKLSWLQRLARRIGEWLDSLFSRTPPQRGSSSWGNWNLGVSGLVKILMLVVGGALLLVLVMLLISHLRKERRVRTAREISRQSIKTALEEGDALAMSSGEWLGEAERLARERDFRSMYRALYLALLSGLHRAGKINFRRTRTNWMYVNAYQGNEDERDLFQDLTTLFDRVWYGFKDPGDQSLDELKRDVAGLVPGEEATS